MKRNRIEIDTRLLNEILTTDWDSCRLQKISEYQHRVQNVDVNNEMAVNHANWLLARTQQATGQKHKADAIEKHFKHHSGHCAECHKPLNDLVLPLDTSVKSNCRMGYKTTRLTACILHTKELKGKVYTGKECGACGVLFKSYGDSKYCSLACRSHSSYHRLKKPNAAVMVCKNCDKDFVPKRTDSLFCNAQCRVIYWRMAKRQIDLFADTDRCRT